MVDVAQRRLHNQQIAVPALESPGEAVRWFGAMQAQDYYAALWAIGLRMRSATEAVIERAIAERDIVRTWPMRGTLHFVPAEAVRWMLALMTPRVLAANAGRYRQLELDERVFKRARRILEKALNGGHQLTRGGVYELLERNGIATSGSRGLHILGHLAQHAVICFGARAGKQPTFVLLDEWVPQSRTLSRDESLAEIARRYFTSHGPATVHDFAWWSGLTMGAAKQAIELLDTQLVREQLGDQTYWSAPATESVGAPQQRAHLLPSYDEYTVAYRDRSAVLAAEHARRASAGGILYPTIVVAARVVGTWKRTLTKTQVEVSLEPFATLPRRHVQEIRSAARRYAAFLGRDLAPTLPFGRMAH